MWKCDLYLRMLKCSCVPNDTSNYYISCTLGNVVPSMECTLLCLSILKVLFIFFTSKWNLISKTQVCFFAMPNYNSKEQYSQPYLENLLFLPWTLVLFSNCFKRTYACFSSSQFLHVYYSVWKSNNSKCFWHEILYCKKFLPKLASIFVVITLL